MLLVFDFVGLKQKDKINPQCDSLMKYLIVCREVYLIKSWVSMKLQVRYRLRMISG